MTTEAGYSGPQGGTIDREVVCWTTTAGGATVFTGTIRHDDTLTGAATPGWALFNQHQTPVPANTPGLTFVDCSTCCPQQIGEGCWDDGADSGEWIAFRLADGTIERTDTITGDPVDDADVVTCADDALVDATTLQPVAAGQQFNIPASTLISWSVRVLTGTATLEVNGVQTVLPTGSIVESSAEDGATLSDSVMVTAGATPSSALLVYVTRT